LIDLLVIVRDHHSALPVYLLYCILRIVFYETKSFFFRSVSADKKERSKKSKKIQDEPSAILNGGRGCEENQASLAAVEMMESKKSASSPHKTSCIPAAAGTEQDLPAAAAKSSCDGKLSASAAAFSTVSASVTGGTAGVLPLRRRASKLSDSEDSSLSTDSPLKGGHIAFICWGKP
jgi:hypothetical protein